MLVTLSRLLILRSDWLPLHRRRPQLLQLPKVEADVSRVRVGVGERAHGRLEDMREGGKGIDRMGKEEDRAWD